MISYLLVFIIFIIQKNITINVIVMLLFLVVVIHKEENKVDYVYNKFLLERFLNKYQFKNKKIIYNINNFYKNKENIYKENGTFYTEKEVLEKKYNFFYKNR